MANSPQKKYPEYPIVADNHYELLGFVPLAKVTKEQVEDAYQDRYKYWKAITATDKSADKTLAMDEIMKARQALAFAANKARYDSTLIKKLLARIDDVIEAAIKIDKELDPNEEQHIKDKGLALGLGAQEVADRTNALLQKYQARRVTQKSRPPDPQKTSGSAVRGKPVFHIKEGESKRRMVFSQVGLRATQSDSFTVTNQGGGFLEVHVAATPKWLLVTPDHFTQDDLPQRVTITVDPQKDACTLGAVRRAAVRLSYDDGLQTQNVNLEVELSVQGREEVARKHMAQTTAAAIGLNALYLFFVLRNLRWFSGTVFKEPPGAMIEAAGAVALFWLGQGLLLRRHKSPWAYVALGLGGLLLWQLLPAALLIMLAVPATWGVAYFFFQRHPTKTAAIGAIPICTFIAGIIGQTQAPALARLNWLSEKTTTATPPAMLPQATVTAEGARLRAAPSKNSRAINTLNRGETIAVLSREGEWYKVRRNVAGQQEGYLFHNLARLHDPNLFPGVAAAPQPAPAIASTSEPSTPSSSVVDSGSGVVDSSGGAAVVESPALVVIQSQPSDAEIILNGKSRGRTPQRLVLPPGAYGLQLQLANYAAMQDSLFIRTDEDSSFTFTYELEVQTP